MTDLSKEEYGLLRQKFLDELGYLGNYDIKEFTVVRTNDRKGYRDERPFINTSPYQGDPQTLIRIEVEVEDDITPGFQAAVSEVIALEKDAIEKAARLKLAQAQQKLRDAQQEIKVAEAALGLSHD